MTQGTGAVPDDADYQRAPNYAARRMLVTTIVIALLVGAAVMVWKLTTEETSEASTPSHEWNTLALVDRATGNVTAVDPEGVVSSTFPGEGRVTAIHTEGDRLALVGTTQVVLAGPGSDAAPIVVPVEAGASVTRLPVADALWLAIGKPSGGNVVLVDGLTGTTIDVGQLSGLPNARFYVDTIRADPDGTMFALAETRNPQTVVVRPNSTAPVFLANQPLAVGGGYVITSEVVGQQADVTLVNAEQKGVATVRIGLPIGAVVDVDNDEAVVVTDDGSIYRFGKGDDQADRVGTIAVPPGAAIQSVHPVAGGSRLVVFGDVFEAVIDLDGKTVFTTTFTDAVELPTIDPGWTCLPAGGTDAGHSVIALDDGEQLADLSGTTIAGTSGDGCTVIGVRGQVTEVTDHDGSVRLGGLRSASLAPDAGAVVTVTSDGAIALVTLEATATGDSVDLAPTAPANPLVGFLQA